MHSWTLMTAAGLSLFTFGVHVFLGGPSVAKPLLESQEMEIVAKYTNYYCWHIVSIVLLAMSIGFAAGALRPQSRDVVIMMTALSAAFTVWSLLLIVWKYRHPWKLPQWTLFLPITILGTVGLCM